MLHNIKLFWSNSFQISDLGEQSFLLRVEYIKNRSRGLLSLFKRSYIDPVLKRFNIQNCWPGEASVIEDDKFYVSKSPKIEIKEDSMKYVTCTFVVGNLVYAQTCHSDRAYAINVFGRFQSKYYIIH